MNSPRKHEHDDDEELALSPVLTRKRFSRRHANRKPYKRSTETSPVDSKSNSHPLEKSPVKPTNSLIPVPVKPVKDIVKKVLQPINKFNSDEHTTDSSLSNFKQQVITNCAKARVISPSKITATVSNQFSTSEGSINAIKFAADNKTESDSKVVQNHKNANVKPDKSHQYHASNVGNHGKYQNTEAKCASGDIYEDEILARKYQPRHVAKIPRKDLDMLYENTKFEGGSKTTVESSSPSLSLSSKDSVTSPRRLPRRQSCSQTPPQCIQEEDTDKEVRSQPNYNDTTDESDALVHQRRDIPQRPCKNKVKSSFLTKNVLDSENSESQRVDASKNENLILSPNLQREIQRWTDEENKMDVLYAQSPSTSHGRTSPTNNGGLFGNHGNALGNHGNRKRQDDEACRGFSVKEIEFIEKKYQKYKEYLLLMGNKKKKFKRSTDDETQYAKHRQGKKVAQFTELYDSSKITDVNISPINKTKLESPHNDSVINGVYVEKQDESIALSANNRVQICIGNNRIQINIKADKKQSLPESGSESHKNDSQSTSKAIDMQSSSKSDENKSNSHGFWSISTDEGKHSERVPTKLNTSSDMKQDNGLFEGFSTAGGKSILVNADKLGAAKRLYSNLEKESSVSNNSKLNKGIEDASSSGFKSGSGLQITMNKGALRRAEELLDEGNKIRGSFNKSLSFVEASGFKSRGENPIKLNTSFYNQASKRFDDLDNNLNVASTSGSELTSRGETATGSTTPTTRFSTDVTKISSDEYKQFVEKTSPVKERKILKAKSMLAKLRGDSGSSSGNGKENFRKSLFLDDFESTKANAQIVEFGKVHSFNFDFKAGFSSASGKKITLSPDKLRAATDKFKDLDFVTPKEAKGTNFSGFSSAAGRKLEVDKEKVEAVEGIDFETPIQPISKFGGFASASGKNLQVDKHRLLRVAARYQELETSAVQTEEIGNLCAVGGFFSEPGKMNKVHAEKLQKASTTYRNLGSDFGIPQVNPSPNVSCGGFSSASGRKIAIDTEKLKSALVKFNDLGSSDALSTSSTKTAHELIEDVVQSYDKALERLNSNIGKYIEKAEDFKTPAKNVIMQTKQDETTPMRPSTSTPVNKKRLGMSRVTNINAIPIEKLEKARLLFEECDKDLTITPMTSFCKTPKNFSTYNTPVTTNSITPARNNCNYINRETSTSGGEKLMSSTPMLQRGCNGRSNDISSFALDFTPIKTSASNKIAKRRRNYDKYDESDEEYDGILLFREKSCSNFQELQNDIEAEYLQLKRKLEILEERKKALEFQRFVIDQHDTEHMRPRLGILSIRKRNPKRVKLSDLPSIISENGDNNHCYNIDARIQEITPRNADKIHFNSLQNHKPVVQSIDGGKVIPNTRSTIGVTEINNAFQAMNGIEPKLIPKGWVANHYKWIVWKLASYERKFPECLRDCLSVDNIMQQLKYRYDREIDKASRPAIRRIMEKDDVPNKRMTLCVADIIQICSNKFELVLTDGWYPIRTIIDNLLSQQIYNGKLEVGTKLMIQGAELMNCDGCHPLEAPDHVKLKIGYNNTRRASWHLRLGYYHIPTPFPIHLKTIQPDGGQVACAKVYVVRVYPIRYMEEYNGVKIWRNSKAEEKRASEFEAERAKELEKIKSQVYDEYETGHKTISSKKIDMRQLKSISCPRQLYHLIEQSHDPESCYSILSPIQKSSIMEYKLNSTSERQKEISVRIAKHVEEMKLDRRIVTPLLKVLVTDALEDSAKCMVLNVWRPTEDQIQLLQEESCVSIYNVGVKRTHELNTVRRTMFRLHEGLVNKRCQRQLLPISMTTDAYYKPLFNEFDTVGLIVEFTIREYDQEVWLADFAGRILYVKIVDGPKFCSFLETAKLGQSVALCNLIMHLPHSEFGQSMANQYSSVTRFPQNKFLQQGLELFNTQLSDIGKLVHDCKAKIESLRAHVHLKSNHSYQDYALLHKSKPNLFDESMNENATIPSRLTMTDVAMSLIDTDKFL